MEFRDLKQQYRVLKNAMDASLVKVLESGRFIGGDEVTKLERRLAEYVGVKHCISCGNGTDALTLVLKAWGIGEGDVVFVPDFTFFATAEAVSLCGATPVFVDVNPGTFNIDGAHLVDAIESVIEEGTGTPRVIISVDLFGLPADYEALSEIAKRYELLLLEDGAQGFGGSIGDRKACSFGDAATTSFFPAKPLGCYGDGGAIFCNDDNLATMISSLKVHGKGSDKYDNIRIGTNSRLDSLQAAVLNVKLDAFIDQELESVNRVAKRYTALLGDIVEVPFIPEGYTSSFAQYTIKLKSKQLRDGLQEMLHKCNIPTMVYYSKPIRKQTVYVHLVHEQGITFNSDMLCNTVLSLPMHPYLDDMDIQRVCDKIREFIEDTAES